MTPRRWLGATFAGVTALGLAQLGGACAADSAKQPAEDADVIDQASADAVEPVHTTVYGDAGIVCRPSDAAFQPSPPRAALAKLEAGCSSEFEITTCYQCKVTPSELGEGSDCDAALTEPSACERCLFTSPDGSSHGVVTIDRGVASLDVSGCIASFEPKCAYAFQQFEDCTAAACGSSCGPPRAGFLADYLACVDLAATTTCAEFFRAKRDECERFFAGSTLCQPENDFQANVVRYGKYFCVRDSGPG